jgi:hypothetical protein
VAAWGPACSVCHSNDCPGCEVETEEDREAEEEYKAKRLENLRRWKLRPAGTEIVIPKQEAA